MADFVAGIDTIIMGRKTWAAPAKMRESGEGSRDARHGQPTSGANCAEVFFRKI
jgi:hypothetical protein